MIGALKALFEIPPKDTEKSVQHRLNLAAAALLIETARADFTLDEIEQKALQALLVNTLDVSAAEVQELVDTAEEHVDRATSLYQYTRVINDHYSAAQKLELIGSMWKVAYADGNLDKYEEHLIRQVADLIYVPHQDYIRTKIEAKN
ncbi:MAG: putative tellurite resistance protein B-like protein [Halioglobus sp.]|jgi:uncharacterized tellurite resistance protein B-like protein